MCGHWVIRNGIRSRNKYFIINSNSNSTSDNTKLQLILNFQTFQKHGIRNRVFKKVGISPALVQIVVPFGRSFLTLVALRSQYSQFGCLRFNFEEILPYPMCRDSTSIYLSTVLMFLLDYFAAAETMWSALFKCFCNMFPKILKTMSTCILEIKTFDIFGHNYIMSTLVFIMVENLIFVLIYIITEQ